MSLLLSKVSKSGYKYVGFDKRSKKLPWFIQYKGKRGRSFENARDAAQYYLDNYVNAAKNWWEKPTAKRSSVDKSTLFGIRIAFRVDVVSCVPKLKNDKIHFLSNANVDCSNLYSARDVNRRFRQYLEHKTMMNKSTQLAVLWKKYTTNSMTRTGTVAGYLPSSEEHVILFDDELEKARASTRTQREFGCLSWTVPPNFHHEDLFKQSDWVRIPWEGNKLDLTAPCGERMIDCNSMLPQRFGPECPRCFANLGIGTAAWSRCATCHLSEPGVLWSLRFSSMRSDENAWPQVHYAETH